VQGEGEVVREAVKSKTKCDGISIMRKVSAVAYCNGALTYSPAIF
jgi:hypothetical protein